MSEPTVVICGNGASAALLVSSLARATQGMDLTVIVVGTGNRLGEGVAYATRNPEHLLNVPAPRMSADPARPDHFAQWLGQRNVPTPGWAGQFVSRALYANYLDELVHDSLAANRSFRLRSMRGEVQSLIRDKLSWLVSCDVHVPFRADIVILATGNDMPKPIASNYAPKIARLIADNPWAELDIGRNDDVLILGSGLTAVDAVINLLDRRHTGPIRLLSRHGLFPAAHVEPEHMAELGEPLPATLLELLSLLKASAGQSDSHWQGLVDAIRPRLPQIWGALPTEEKRRFLRHAATYWNVHRHRMAPQVAARIEEALGKNVRLIKGRLTGLKQLGETALAVSIATGRRTEQISVNQVINCTGPNTDPNKSHDPLIENIIASRQAQVDLVGIGLAVDETNRVYDAEGAIQLSLFALGALTRGRWWEITAIPEIGRQVEAMTGSILAQLALLRSATPSAYTETHLRPLLATLK